MISIKVIIKIRDAGIHLKIPSFETFLGWHNPFLSKFRKTSNPMTFKDTPFKAASYQDPHTHSECACSEVCFPPSFQSLSLTHQEGKSSYCRLPTPSAQRIALSYILQDRVLLIAPPSSLL